MTLENVALKCMQQPLYGVLQWVQFRVKLNESEKIEKRNENRKMTPKQRSVFCVALCAPIVSIQHCKVNVEWILIHAISTKALPFLMHSLTFFQFSSCNLNCIRMWAESHLKNAPLDLVATPRYLTAHTQHTNLRYGFKYKIVNISISTRAIFHLNAINVPSTQHI